MRPIVLPVNFSNWYFTIGGDTTQVYSSAAAAYVPVTDPTYVAWAEKPGHDPMNFSTQAGMEAILARRFPAGLPNNSTDPTALVQLDPNIKTLLAQLSVATPTQIVTYVNNNVTDLASAKTVLARIIGVLALLVRGARTQ